MKRVEILLRWFNVLIILTTFVAYISPFVSPEKVWFVSLFGTAYPWLLLANFIMAGLWIVLKKKYFFFSLACILMGWNHLNGFVGLHFGSANFEKKTIKIISYNAQEFPYSKAGYRITDDQKSNEIFQFLQSKGTPDIMCLQEVDDYHTEPLMKYFGFQDHYKIRYYGTGIYSRYPIVEKGRIEFKLKLNSCLWADIQMDDQVVRVYSLHLQSNSVSNVTEKVMADGQLESETWSDIRTILGRLKRTSKIRANQAEIIAQHIATSPNPVIVCGDFNETPQSYAYRLIAENLNDTFKAKGLGLGTTYAGSIPALRIDYILSDEKFKIIDNHILKKGYSDHYPVMSTLSIN